MYRYRDGDPAGGTRENERAGAALTVAHKARLCRPEIITGVASVTTFGCTTFSYLFAGVLSVQTNVVPDDPRRVVARGTIAEPPRYRYRFATIARLRRSRSRCF